MKKKAKHTKDSRINRSEQQEPQPQQQEQDTNLTKRFSYFPFIFQKQFYCYNNMVGTLSVKINEQQLNSVMNFLKNLTMNLKKQVTSDTEKVAIKVTQDARSKAHVVTGAMRNSINYKKSGESQFTVSADIDYAVYENARGSPHDFFDQAVSTAQSTLYNTVQAGVKAVITKKK